MKAIDLETYQTLTKTLIQQQEHPYQPHQSISNRNYTTTKDLYLTIRKTIQRRTVQQHEEDNTMMVRSFELQGTHDEIFDPSLQDTFPRFNTDDLLKQPQLFIIHPQSKKQLQPTFESKTIKKTQRKQPLYHQLNQESGAVTEYNKLNLQDLIAKPSQIPMKEQNYFQNIGGFDKFYNPTSPKSITMPPKRYPFIFLSNSSMLLSLFLAVRLDDHIFWMIFAAIVVIYLLIGYYNEVREKLFSMRSMEELQSGLAELKKIKGHFLFNIECFHYIRCGNHEQKAVSYRKTKKLVPFQSEDYSFEVSTIQSQGKYIDLSPKNQYYMIDKESEARFITIFNQFVTKYKQDVHQKYNFSFQTSSQSKLQGIYCQGGTYSHIIYIICGLFGMLFPFALWFQCRNTRQQVKIIKRLTIK